MIFTTKIIEKAELMMSCGQVSLTSTHTRTQSVFLVVLSFCCVRAFLSFGLKKPSDLIDLRKSSAAPSGRLNKRSRSIKNKGKGVSALMLMGGNVFL